MPQLSAGCSTALDDGTAPSITSGSIQTATLQGSCGPLFTEPVTPREASARLTIRRRCALPLSLTSATVTLLSSPPRPPSRPPSGYPFVTSCCIRFLVAFYVCSFPLEHETLLWGTAPHCTTPDRSPQSPASNRGAKGCCGAGRLGSSRRRPRRLRPRGVGQRAPASTANPIWWEAGRRL